MDANGNVIPIVENDQGEGFKDEIDPLEFLNKQISEIAQEKHRDILRKELTGKDSYQEQVEKKLAQQPQQAQLMKIQKGMTIHFYGYAYKCTAARPNGKVTLKLKGLWKGDQR